MIDERSNAGARFFRPRPRSSALQDGFFRSNHVCGQPRMKTGIVLLAELAGPIAERIHEIQREFDPRMAAELPPHITLSGSSGMGPIPNDTPVEDLRRTLEPIARDTAPITVRFQPPHKFLQSLVVVLPIDPYGPIR